MGTSWSATARCPAAETEVLDAVERALEAVDASMSTYRGDSELSRINTAEPGRWTAVSPELMEVLEAASRLHALSDGAFDVTVGALVNAWGFGPDGSHPAPTDAQLGVLMRGVGFEHVILQADPPRVMRTRQGVSIDLSAIAKGYAVDRAAAGLAAMGCTDYMIDVGGEVKVAGRNPRGQAWRIGVERPDPAATGQVAHVLSVDRGAVATSGDYRNFREVDGRLVSHTIDPRSGFPVEHALASVTVAHASAMWADGFATAINVLGPDAGMTLAEAEGLAALLIVRGEEGTNRLYTAAMYELVHAP